MGGQDIGPVLLKLRLLASRLGSELLEDWVKHESEGYPKDAEVPDYRRIEVSYTATFSGPFGSGIQNAPIPPHLIAKFASEEWNTCKIRQSIASIDNLIRGADDANLGINASNLILLLQGKIYNGYACNSVSGTVSKSALAELQNAVRTRILDLTIQVEKQIPAAAEISTGPLTQVPESADSKPVTQITQNIIRQNIIRGNVTAISSSGAQAQFNLSIGERDDTALVQALVAAGIAESDAAELAGIVASEAPESREEPLGTNAKAWFAQNIRKAVDGTWKVGVTVATNVLTEAVMKFYGLK